MKKKVIIIISSIVVVLGLLVAAYFIFLKGEDKITISFDTDGGSVVQKMEIKKNEKINLPITTKEGYQFLGWYLGDTLVDNSKVYTENTTLKAKWQEEKKDFTVTFNSNGGSKVNSIKVECGKELKLPSTIPTKDGYTFRVWTDKNGRAILNGALLTCEDLTLYAEWEKKNTKTFTVTFNSNGGSTVNKITVECNKALPTLPTPTRSNYKFLGWTNASGKTVNKGDKLACSNVTLTAKWEAEKTYKCPTGYTLNGTKCTKEISASERCPSGTKVDGSLCINTSISNDGTRVCKSDTVPTDGKGHTWTGKGDYHFNGAYGKCAYYKWTNYTTKSQCEAASDINHRTVWVSDLNACYAEDKMNNYETNCSSGYKYYSSEELKTKFGLYNNGKCLKTVAKEKYCNSPYVFKNGKCVQTINATLS